MTNYFGKNRLKKIFYKYLSVNSELVKKIQNDGILTYKKHRGSEWLECNCGDYRFKIYTFGETSKVVTLDEYHYDDHSGKYKSFNRVVSYYDETFHPMPHNKNKSLDRYGIDKKNCSD